MSTKRDSPSYYSYKDMSCYKAQGCAGRKRMREGLRRKEEREGKDKSPNRWHSALKEIRGLS